MLSRKKSISLKVPQFNAFLALHQCPAKKGMGAAFGPEK